MQSREARRSHLDKVDDKVHHLALVPAVKASVMHGNPVINEGLHRSHGFRVEVGDQKRNVVVLMRCDAGKGRARSGTHRHGLSSQYDKALRALRKEPADRGQQQKWSPFVET